jgi:hypothetical protein
MKNDIYKQAFKQFCLFCLWVALARVSKGFILPVMALLGVAWALKGDFGKALSIYAMLMFMVALNPNILPKIGMMYSLGLRFGPLLIGLALAMRGMMIPGRQALPLGMMLLFILVAAISSAGGWYPIVSYMKLINFLVFFLGVWLGTKGLQQDEQGVMIFRATLLALCTFLIAGSAALWPFPGISTLNSLKMISEVDDVAMRNAIIREMIDSGNTALFCGVTYHSQTMSPLLTCAFAWVTCDLLFVEGGGRWPHVGLLILALPLLYLTRSRVALLGVTVTLALVYFYLPQKLALDRKMKMWLGHILLVGGVALLALVAIAEVQSNAISRWLRKTDDVQTDQRSLSEAFTASRQGLIEMCMDDFKRRPLIGMGFQVAEYTQQMADGQKGLILSSPIEKGVIPVMVLGETGVVGAIVFAVFLLIFYNGCINKRLYITLAMMTVFLTINLGEATFFSPGGPGGPEWLFCVVGGYALDLILSNRQRRIERWL